ncbi:hypothetical protein [Pseudomonas asplenii]|uniref:Uncharacterized protein n=1 Tax=Pseudomonas asplenii TaxID=53407 RepID=A0A1H6NMV4_9PSED|nr:hypothetical protein [Pseudomonas fuscovaginae]SEI17128.1 hypothetical protein SAMN05216581_3311 [Pseudomonas fuscovaginae]
MDNQRLAPTNPTDYRYAVHCCSYKLDLGSEPDRAVALFDDSVAAVRFGGSMWPSTFEVIDLSTGESIGGGA